MNEAFDEWLARQSAELSNDEIRELWKVRGRYPHLDAFDEKRMDVIGTNGNEGLHYEHE